MLTSLERSLAISHLIKEIISSNEHIHFVSSINKNGRVTEYELGNDRIITNMTKQEKEMLFMQRTLQNSLAKEFDDIIGPLDCITLQRETLLEFIFPYSEGLIFVLSDLEVIPRFLSKKISLMLRDFEWMISTTLC